jgi:hypothetical protein
MPSPDDRTSYPQPTDRTSAAPEPYTQVESRGLRTEVQPVYPHAAPASTVAARLDRKWELTCAFPPRPVER